jgi:hypothetical protein
LLDTSWYFILINLPLAQELACNNYGEWRCLGMWASFRPPREIQLSFINLCLVYFCAFLLFIRLVLVAFKRYFTVQLIVV